MVNIAKGVFGGLMLFLGRDMDWLFSLGLGLLVGLKLTALLAADSPPWIVYLLVAAVAAISVLPYLVFPDASYIVTGFLFGGFLLSEYGSNLLITFFGRGLSGSTWLVFIAGAVVGAVILGLAREWGIMFATALAGGLLISDIFTNVTPIARYLIAAGLFLAGSIIQVVLLGFDRSDRR
jgi:hypothetical protein